MLNHTQISEVYEVNISYCDPVTEEIIEISKKLRGSNSYNVLGFCLSEIGGEISQKSRENNIPKTNIGELVITVKPCGKEDESELRLENLAQEKEEVVLA